MRVTLNLDDDAVKLLRKYSKAHSLPLGKAASELVRRGANAPVRERMVNGFVVFDIPPGSPKITTERVKQLSEDEIYGH